MLTCLRGLGLSGIVGNPRASECGLCQVHIFLSLIAHNSIEESMQNVQRYGSNTHWLNNTLRIT